MNRDPMLRLAEELIQNSRKIEALERRCAEIWNLIAGKPPTKALPAVRTPYKNRVARGGSTRHAVEAVAANGPMTSARYAEVSGISAAAAGMRLSGAAKAGALVNNDGTYSIPSVTVAATENVG